MQNRLFMVAHWDQSRMPKCFHFRIIKAYFFELLQTADGILYLLNLISTQNSFVYYLKNMASWLEENQYFGYRRISIILDNCSIHRSRKTIEFLNARPWDAYFLPPYSLQLAPVELAFNHLKTHIKHRRRDASLKLNATEALSHALEIMKPIKAKSVKGYYAKFFQTLKSFLPIFK